MAKYKIFHSATFDRVIGKLDKEFHDWLEKIERQLVDNPYGGDPLGVKWFREKKHGKARVYYLVYDHISSVYMVGVSEKKNQKRVINTIKLLLEYYKKEIEELVEPT